MKAEELPKMEKEKNLEIVFLVFPSEDTPQAFVLDMVLDGVKAL